MMTCPAIVPTVEDERPDASSESANTADDALPSSGSSVRCASSIVPISVSPCWKNVEAAMTRIAALIRPARLIAISTSTN